MNQKSGKIVIFILYVNLFMNEEELLSLQKRYETPGEGYGHFKLTLLDKIEEYFEPYSQEKRLL